MARALGGEVAHTGLREFGGTPLTLAEDAGVLLADLPADQSVWMSHGDSVSTAPPGFTVTAGSPGARVAAFENTEKRLAGVQFHPEVAHTPHGQEVLRRFLTGIAGIEPTWSNEEIIDDGLLRAGEAEQVEKDYVAATGIKLKVVDAADRFLGALAGVTDPEQKRKIIGREFIRVFEQAAREVAAEHDVEFLVQGTLYPDVVESGGGAGTANIKSHHNVGGLPEDLKFRLVEPLRTLFKDEVRAIGAALGLPDEIVWRHPFPGPGLAIRIVGEVTRDRLELLRAADRIAREELTLSGLDRRIWQFPVVLLADVRSVGVQGDGRTYGHPVVLRPVESDDAMTADWSRLPYDVIARISTRITNEVPEVNRVVLDVTSKPPGTIEWE
jgi:GMP synthase (glutamine-hydrolysing)